MHHLSSYSLLFAPKYRVLRYALLCITLFIFGYSEISYHYPQTDRLPFMALAINSFLCKLIPSVLMIVFVFPFLLKRRYMMFWICVVSLVLVFLWMEDVVMESWICEHFNLRPWNEDVHFLFILIDLLSQSALWFMTILGVLMGRMIKYWIKENEIKQQVLASGLQMETETMKEQVAPSLLCNTLRVCGESAEAKPQEASDTLMRLSRLLRYQLYDCRQEKVWLESELKFLKEYLAILKYNAGCACFHLSVSGQTMGVSIPSLLFVPFLQSDEIADQRMSIDIDVQIQNGILTFELTDGYIRRNDRNVRNRLNQLYPQRHTLVIEPKHVILTIQI